jgi:hypothetical protein
LNPLHENVLADFQSDFEAKLVALTVAAVRFAQVAGRGSDAEEATFSRLADAALAMGGHAEERSRFNLEPPAMSDDAQPLCEAAIRWAVGEHILNDWRDLRKEFSRFSLGDRAAGDILADVLNELLSDAAIAFAAKQSKQKRKRRKS